ncbi:hypothetical protein [Streptomyces sp. NPDC004589]|uniref:hypothetical protein n=1 Tax=Streptomyces sp. NPDC004589 TaxID=3154553 RepID=UPI0033A3419A
MAWLHGEIDEAEFRDFRESVISVVERSAVNPRREVRWERIHVILCILAIVGGSALTSYLAVALGPAGAVMTLKNKNADHWQAFAGFFMVAAAFSLVGLILERRRVIYRIAVGRIKPARYEAVHYNFPVYHIFHMFLPAWTAPFAVGAFLLLRGNSAHWPYGWAAVAMAGIVGGYAVGRSTWAIWAWMMRRTADESEQSLDVVVNALFLATTLMYASLRSRDFHLRSVRRYVRYELFALAANVEHSKVPLELTFRVERHLRGEIKVNYARIAQAIRAHARKLATIQNEGQYREISSSLLGGLRAALAGDMETLLENAPEVSRSSRVRNFLRHITPAVAMALFAAIIPVLPGVGDAAGSVRVLLLATAALTLIPGAGSARPTIEGALSRALPGSQKP